MTGEKDVDVLTITVFGGFSAFFLYTEIFWSVLRFCTRTRMSSCTIKCCWLSILRISIQQHRGREARRFVTIKYEE